MQLLWGLNLLLRELKSPYDSEDKVLGLEWLNVAVHLAQSCTATALLAGVYQDNASLLSWWLWSCPVAAILETTLLTPAVHHVLHVHRRTVTWYLLTITALVDDVCGWLVTFSHYRALRGRGPALV